MLARHKHVEKLFQPANPHLARVNVIKQQPEGVTIDSVQPHCIFLSLLPLPCQQRSAGELASVRKHTSTILRIRCGGIFPGASVVHVSKACALTGKSAKHRSNNGSLLNVPTPPRAIKVLGTNNKDKIVDTCHVCAKAGWHWAIWRGRLGAKRQGEGGVVRPGLSNGRPPCMSPAQADEVCTQARRLT